MLNIVDGREQLAEEMGAAPAALRERVSAIVAGVIADRNFPNVLPGLIAEPERADLVLTRLRNLVL